MQLGEIKPSELSPIVFKHDTRSGMMWRGRVREGWTYSVGHAHALSRLRVMRTTGRLKPSRMGIS